MMEKIDNLDRKILSIIMRNARIPSKDVALECGVSRAAIHQRIQRLIDMQVITGSGYTVNPKKLGCATDGKDTGNRRVSLHHRPLYHAHQALCPR